MPAFRLGQLGGLEVLLCDSRQGNRAAQRKASDIWNAFQPLAIVSVGVAFGVDATKQAIGDAATGWLTLRFGGLLSGEKLVDDPDYREDLKELAGQDDIVGGEMESAGLYHALYGRA